jgi:CRISPR-associated protein Csd1
MLNRLIDYAHIHVPQSEPGFTVRDIRWRIEISSDGQLVGIIPLGDGTGGTERWNCPEMHDMQSGGKAHFLIDNLKTAILLLGRNPTAKALSDAKPRHEFFVARIQEAAVTMPILMPLAIFLGNEVALESLRQTLLAPPHKAGPNENIEWCISGCDPVDDSVVTDWWRTWRTNDLGGAPKHAAKMVCFGTGDVTLPMLTQPKIMRLPGGQGSGDALIGFDKAAFTSHGLKKSSNAAVSEKAARQYVDALNHLVRHHSRKLGENLVLHWFKGALQNDDDVLAWLQEPPEVAISAAAIAAKRLLEAIHRGDRPELSSNEFYALTVSGMSGRVMVREWMEGKFEDLVRHVEAWFSDLAIVARDGTDNASDPKFMAVCGALVRELKDLPAPTAATLWKVAVQRLPIPQSLMAQALARFRTDLVDKDKQFNHARMGLIKAYFVRLKPGGDSNMTAYLNPNHPAPAYHCGRLLAIFASLQRAALGDVGAGVVQRYYAATSQTPGLILGRLATNSRNHLAKLEGGLGFWYETKIADVMCQLGDGAPRILDLEGQGLFALGYYQQLAALRSGNNKASDVATTNISNQGEAQ